MYVFDNSENHNKIAMDYLNACKLNQKDGGGNTPIVLYWYFKRSDGAIVVHTMQNETGLQKGLCTILTE